jgi:Holliday junction resolvase-like predicted endonuclease
MLPCMSCPGRSTQCVGSAQRVGATAERLVASRLIAGGWTILARNVRVGRDEIDLVGIDPGPPPMLVVVEVRWRGRRDFGLAEETLDRRKRAALRRATGTLIAAGALPDGRPLPMLPFRVDLVAVDPGAGGLPSVRHHRGVRP